MQIKIKKFNVEMEVKAAGIEFEVREPKAGPFIGDCYLTMSGLVWCKGKATKANGIKMSWEDFMEIMKSNRSMKKAVLAAKKS